MAKRRAAPLQKPRDARKTGTTDESEPAPVLKGRGPWPPVDRSAVDGKLLDLEGVLDALSIVVEPKPTLRQSLRQAGSIMWGKIYAVTVNHLDA